MGSKRGALSIEIIIVIVICIIVLILLTTGVGRTFTNFLRGINSCEAKGGDCLPSCGDRRAIPAGNPGCEKEFKGQTFVCCEREEMAGVEERGYGAHTDLIKVVLDKEKTPLYYGERRDLEIRDTPYKIEAVLDYKELASLAGTPDTRCSFFLKDVDTNKEYVLTRLQGDLSGDTTKPYPLLPIEETFNSEKSFIISCTGVGNDKLWPRYFKPTESQEGRTYALRIIVYDESVTNKTSSRMGGFSDELKNLIFDQEHWVAEFTAYLRVKPIIEISGISGIWVASDDIIVRVNEPYKLSKVEVAIVPDQGTAITGSDQKSLSQQIQAACNSASATYKSSIHKITALKAGTEGLHLVFTSIGRKNYQQQMYESQAQPIEITENQAKIHLDASSISETFQIDDMLEEEDKPLKEQYLCVKAQIAGPAGTPRTRTTYSQQPLRLDVAPPLIDNTDDYMSVVYPDARVLENNLQQLLSQGRISPGQQVTPFYFDEYPKVIIKKCFDKSGCKNYDYYFAPTYIRVNINAADLETGLVSLIIGQGLNYLYNYLVTRDPLKTICPLANSGQYRRNTHPEMRARRGEQGVFCIKVSDDVGNYWLTWKTVYNPYDVVEDITQEVIT